MNKQTQDTRVKIAEILAKYACDSDECECKLFKMVDAILRIIEEREIQLANDICRLIDKVESKDENTSMEQWKQYKHIRNAIRDEYVLSHKKI